MPEPLYLFTRGARGIFAEVYFPKKIGYQGIIFTALEEGYTESIVKKYLDDNVEDLLTELADFPYGIFDPYRYGTLEKPSEPETEIEKAKKRTALYASPFRGWSMYEVDGVFFKEVKKEREGKVEIEEVADEERTQVVRIIFRFESEYKKHVQEQKVDCRDVFRSMLFFLMKDRGHIAGEGPWDEATKQRFMLTHEPWRDLEKRAFVEQYFPLIAQEVRKWIEDTALFLFGYLVRKFSRKVLEKGRVEDEIWVTSFFDLQVNVVQKPKQT